MAPLTKLHQLLTFLLLLSVDVHAGHPLWEYTPPATLNGTSLHQPHKRAFAIRPDAYTQKVWPGCKIKYCYENADAKAKLDSYLKTAMLAWHAATLPDNFELVEISDDECRNNRKNSLVISNVPGVLTTTPGIQYYAQDSTKPGPTMILTTSTSVGFLDVVANFAHELGHAFGLLHLHQVPTLWHHPDALLSRDFFKFNCKNLKDYEKAYAIGDDNNENPGWINKCCSDYAQAAAIGFSAAEYLPMNVGQHDLPFPVDEDVDWDSIMLYPSGAGGNGPASPDDDQRPPVLQRIKEDGSVEDIPIRYVPSPRDVAAVKKLYDAHLKYTTPQLLNDPKHPKNSRFKSFLKKCAGK